MDGVESFRSRRLYRLGMAAAGRSKPGADAMLRSLATGDSASSPPLLKYEVSNALVSAFAKRRRISREQCFSKLREFDGLAIRYDSESLLHASTTISQLASDHELTVYDAAYVELALRKDYGLATLDGRMATVAKRLRIRVISGQFSMG